MANSDAEGLLSTMLALHKFSCSHYPFSQFILSSEKFQLLKFTKPCPTGSSVGFSTEFLSVLSVIFCVLLSGGNGSGQKGAAASKVVPELDPLGPWALSMGGYFRGPRTVMYR